MFHPLFYLCLFLSALVETYAFAIGGPVNTTSGPVQGQSSSLRPEVSEYLGIPFAQPPVGNLRFAAPLAVTRSSGIINATSYVSYFHEFCTIADDATESEGDILNEDCLTINIWTKPQQGEKQKAVLFWIYGGGFAIGSTASPVYDGSILADENDVVVVSFNYRLNIFGFSGAPGQPWNVGLLDQRLALEWTRDNIAQFGGDPSRITVFGQSAGGLSTDFLAYSYPEDPIAHALIAHSGAASSALSASSDMATIRKTWYNVSATLGCGGADAGEATVACMRARSSQDLLDAIAPLTAGGMLGGFTPVGDGTVVPIDVPAAGIAGKFARIPFMTGNTDNEAGFFLITALAYSNLTAEEVAALPMTLIQPLGDLLTLVGFTCPAAEAARYRSLYDVPVWRYRYYGGNYSNTYIIPVGSAYHTSELPIVFGTAATVTGVADTKYEAQAAAYMRDAWAAFAKNPNDLRNVFQWPTFHPLTRSEIQLSYGQQTEASYIFNIQTDAFCPTVKLFSGILEDIAKILSRLGIEDSSSSLLSIFDQPLNTDSAVKQALSSLQLLASQV
ncbi:uncharacterized protein CDV56_102850 [Aspergillus thermomutatus]|uniref:Carboxylic ester hydrolase n=1 Tax=Aspergillus thermomutatus TaxID=41047 RepID=A0A397GFE4_ASPTH|nr:uncharacterized protein CDV56_102850 [Aspergillus thermomutatus]RHZ49641.1 hypothetical protein CDV56_102850 [Aspergillus thermomutatus]